MANEIIKEVRKKFRSLPATLSCADAIEEIAARIEEVWDNIPRTEVEASSSPTEMYESLLGMAEQGKEGEDVAFISEERCYIRATKFSAILAEKNFYFKRKQVLDAYKQAGLLCTNTSRNDIKKISHLNLTELKVRSGLTCGLEYGVCQKCYGWALTTQNWLMLVKQLVLLQLSQSVNLVLS